jgi:hypothetical protein
MATTPLASCNEHRLPEQELDGGRDSVRDYCYEPLVPGHIRVVNLSQHHDTAQEKLSGREDLWCTLEQVDISHANYTAISYEWGSQDKPFSILVMDRNKNSLGAVRLTATLRNVLFDLIQSPIEPKVFWIDQLCIDQSDSRDKSIQIPEMGRIYRNASQVLTYLGPAEPRDPEGLELMDQICHHYETVLTSIGHTAPIWNEDLILSQLFERSPDKKLHVAAEKPAWANLCRVLLTGWFKRRWMVQENVLNKNSFFLRGPRKFKQATGNLIVRYILYGILPRPTGVKLSSASAQDFCTTAGLDMCRSTKLTMIDVLWLFSNTECYDPRDRIFALLGTASDAGGLNITVDYSKTENEVLISLATRMVEYHRNLKILKRVIPQMTAKKGLPTWVPYWDTPDRSHASEIMDYTGWEAANMFDISCAFEDEGKVLNLKGLRLGKLEANLGASGYPSIHFNYTCFLEGNTFEGAHQQIKVLNQIQELWVDSKDEEYALACTLVCSTHMSKYSEMDSKETSREGVLRTFRNCVRLLKHAFEPTVSQSSKNLSYSTAVSSPPSMTDSEKQVAVKFIKDIFIYNRAFWTINGRHLCLAPATARAGDLVTVLLGGPLLYILRPTKDEGRYVFVGTAFVHGFMEGEAVQSPNWEQELEIFRLV